ncbi:stress responsive a/B barrel domain-containing protein [Sarocladium implicatum]|nr:stress responsive a/B barrel domain-containing protein [Sarocladium implicatum]
MASRVHRITMFKLPKVEDQKVMIEEYKKMWASQPKKDGKPYILSLTAGPAEVSERAQGYTFVAKSEYGSVEDMMFYDTECEAHKALKATAKGLAMDGPPLMKNSRLFLDLQSSPIVLGEAESRASSARLRDICNLRARLSEVEKTLSIFLGERIFRAETTEKGLMQTYVTQNSTSRIFLTKEAFVLEVNFDESALVESLDKALNACSFQPALQGGFALVLALIQNEDDNRCSVESVPNVLLLMYNQGGTRYVRSDCNDAGFTLRQLDVLSQVVKSTKFAIIRNTKSYLGEKDIGFNSVFTV